MTDTATAPAPDVSRDYMQKWAESMAHVLGQISAVVFGVECSDEAPDDAVPPHASDFQVVITSSGTLQGELILRMPKSVTLAMAQLLLNETQGPAVEFSSRHQEAAQELLRQISGHAATALKSRWGEVHLDLAFGDAPSRPAETSGWMVSSSGTSFRIWLEWQISASLLSSLRRAESEAKALAQSAAQSEAEVASQPGHCAAAVPPDKAGIFMDVELGVTLRFGGKRMVLREILELNSGSVVELDREVQEPVDLLLDGKVIARGEVVVVDGNYGMRVLEVYSSGAAPAGK